MSNKSGISINNGNLYANVVAVNGDATNTGSAVINVAELSRSVEELRRAIPPEHAASVAPEVGALEAAVSTGDPEMVKSKLHCVVDALKSAGVAVGAVTELVLPITKIAALIGTSLVGIGL